MTVKLHINISQGIIDVEGDADLVRDIYDDFKERLLAGSAMQLPEQEDSPDLGTADDGTKVRPKTKRKAQARKRVPNDEAVSSISADAPKLDRDLDTSKLAAFFGQFAPKNHPEKILIIATFLTEELEIESPNTDQIYTCYLKVNERVPKAFAQAFRDTSGKSFGYIEYKSPIDFRITTAGANHFKFDLKKKAAE